MRELRKSGDVDWYLTYGTDYYIESQRNSDSAFEKDKQQ